MASLVTNQGYGQFRSTEPGFDPVRRFAPLRDADDAFRSALVARRRLEAGVEVYHQGEIANEFYVLNSGWMSLYRLLPDGRRHIVKFAMPGDMVGFSLAAGLPMDHAAVAITEATVAVLDREAVLRHYPRDAVLTARLGWYFTREHTLALQQLTSVTRATAVERVSHLMLELFIRARRRLPEPNETLAVPLTQEQIGDAVGLSAVHVNRMLAELRQSGVLTLTSGLLTIICPNRLQDLAALDAAAVLDSLSLGQPAVPVRANVA